MITNLSRLQNGTFARNKSFDPDWIKQRKIPESYFNKAWSFQELKDALINLSKYSLEGYWPKGDKSNFKSLPNLIYNPMTRKSLLLNSIKNPPKELDQIAREKPFDNPYPKTTKKIKASFIWPKNYKLDERILCKHIKELYDWAENIINHRDDINRFASYWYGNLGKVTNQYLKWLEDDDQDWLDKRESIFSIYSNTFSRFIEAQEKEWDIIIRSKDWKR